MGLRPIIRWVLKPIWEWEGSIGRKHSDGRIKKTRTNGLIDALPPTRAKLGRSSETATVKDHSAARSSSWGRTIQGSQVILENRLISYARNKGSSRINLGSEVDLGILHSITFPMQWLINWAWISEWRTSSSRMTMSSGNLHRWPPLSPKEAR